MVNANTVSVIISSSPKKWIFSKGLVGTGWMGHLKSKAFVSPLADLDDLEGRITAQFNALKHAEKGTNLCGTKWWSHGRLNG